MHETKFVGMEYFGSHDESTAGVSVGMIGRGDVYVGIIGHRFGSGITEQEYTRALQRKLPCLIYFKKGAGAQTFPGDSPEDQARLAAFKVRLRAHTITEFTEASELGSKVAVDLHNWLADNFLKQRLEEVVRGEGPAWDAQALVRAVRDVDLVPVEVRQQLEAAGLHLFSGSYERLRDAYIPADAVFRRAGVDSFCGREWLTGHLDAFLKAHDRGYFVLEAAAGMGKTAFLAHLVRQRGYIHHFAETSRETGMALRSLTAQVILTCELSGEGIPAVLPPIAGQPAYFAQMLERASAKLRMGPIAGLGNKLVIIVDGLDEAVPGQQENAFGLPEEPPKGVYFVISKRPVPVRLRSGDTPRVQEQIHADRVENLRDLRTWLEARVEDEAIRRAVRPATETDFVEAVLRRSQGVWIYVHYLLAEIAHNVGPVDLNVLPRGLWEYYAKFWQSWRDKHIQDWDTFDLKVLATLAALQEESTAEFLRAQSGTQREFAELRRRLERDWRAFIAVTDGTPARYRIYHASLRQFFEGTVESQDTGDREFIRELAEATVAAHGRLAEYYVTMWGGLARGLPKLGDVPAVGPEAAYGRRWLAAHLEMAGRAGDLHQLLRLERKASIGRSDNLWYRVQEAAQAIPQFVADVARAWTLSAASGDLAVQARCALITCSVNNAARNLPRQMLVALVEKGVWTVDQAVLYAREILDTQERALALVGLAAAARGDEREAMEREARQAMRALSSWDSLWAELALSTDPLDPALLDNARQFSPPFRACLLVAAAERAPREAEARRRQCLQEASEAAWPPKDREEPGEARARLMALAGAFSILDARMKEQVRDWALNLVGGVRQPDAILIRHSVSLMLFAGGLAKMGLSKDILAAEVAGKHAGALADIAPYLSEPDLRRALSLARSTKSTRALAGILPRLAELGHPKEALRILLKQFTIIDVAGFKYVDRRPWDELIGPLAPCLPADVLGEAVASAPQIGDTWERLHSVEALIGIAGWKRAIRRALQVALTPVSSLLAVAMGGRPEPSLPARIVGIVAAAGLPRAALWLLTRLPTDHQQCQAMQQISGRLPEPLVRRAFEIARSLDGWSWDAMATVSLLLPEEMAQQVFQEMTQSPDKTCLSTEKVLVNVLLRLAELGHIDQVWAALPELTVDYNRALVLEWLVRFVSEPRLREILQFAGGLSDESLRRNVMKGAAVRLAQLGLCSEAMDMATELALHAKSTGALSGVARALDVSDLREVKTLWDKALIRLAEGSRAGLMNSLVALSPVIRTLGGSAASKDIAEAIRSVGRWWP